MTLDIVSFRSILRCVVLILALLSIAAKAQITPSADTYINTADRDQLRCQDVARCGKPANHLHSVRFVGDSVELTGANVSQGTLKLYVNAITTAGSFNVDYVNGIWSESTINAAIAPALGTTIVSSVPLTTARKNQYILINITPAVEAWLNGSQANDGIALVGNSPVNANFDSKESTTTSHSPELDIVFAGGGGGITGITTASGSGLMGGGHQRHAEFVADQHLRGESSTSMER